MLVTPFRSFSKSFSGRGHDGQEMVFLPRDSRYPSQHNRSDLSNMGVTQAQTHSRDIHGPKNIVPVSRKCLIFRVYDNIEPTEYVKALSICLKTHCSTAQCAVSWLLYVYSIMSYTEWGYRTGHRTVMVLWWRRSPTPLRPHCTRPHIKQCTAPLPADIKQMNQADNLSPGTDIILSQVGYFSLHMHTKGLLAKLIFTEVDVCVLQYASDSHKWSCKEP